MATQGNHLGISDFISLLYIFSSGWMTYSQPLQVIHEHFYICTSKRTRYVYTFREVGITSKAQLVHWYNVPGGEIP